MDQAQYSVQSLSSCSTAVILEHIHQAQAKRETLCSQAAQVSHAIEHYEGLRTSISAEIIGCDSVLSVLRLIMAERSRLSFILVSEKILCAAQRALVLNGETERQS